MRSRVLLAGHPNSGKTVAVAELVNAGFKVVHLDFDNKHESMLPFIRVDHGRGNLAVEPFDVGDPADWDRSMKLLDRLQKEPPSTVVVTDTISFAGQLAFRAELAKARLPLNAVAVPEKLWGEAAKRLELLVLKQISPKATHSVLVLSHLRPAEDDRTKKMTIVPTTIGVGYSQTIIKQFPDIWIMEGREKRRLLTEPTVEYPWLRRSLLTKQQVDATSDLGALFTAALNFDMEKAS